MAPAARAEVGARVEEKFGAKVDQREPPVELAHATVVQIACEVLSRDVAALDAAGVAPVQHQALLAPLRRLWLIDAAVRREPWARGRRVAAKASAVEAPRRASDHPEASARGLETARMEAEALFQVSGRARQQQRRIIGEAVAHAVMPAAYSKPLAALFVANEREVVRH